MKACASSAGYDLNAPIDPRFGRCRVFLFVDTETMEYEAVENPAMMAGGGAGTQAAQMVANKGATVVLTGNVGPNAFSALDAAGIKIYVGLSGTVQDAINRLNQGGLQETNEATVSRHFGTGQGRGRGRR